MILSLRKDRARGYAHYVLCAKQMCAVSHDFHASVECLLGKVDLQRIVDHLNRYYIEQPVHKIKIDDDDVWKDDCCL